MFVLAVFAAATLSASGASTPVSQAIEALAKPDYPANADPRRSAGFCTARLEVLEDGGVQATDIECAATRHGDRFGRESLEAAEQWRLDPALAGQDVRVCFTFTRDGGTTPDDAWTCRSPVAALPGRFDVSCAVERGRRAARPADARYGMGGAQTARDRLDVQTCIGLWVADGEVPGDWRRMDGALNEWDSQGIRPDFPASAQRDGYEAVCLVAMSADVETPEISCEADGHLRDFRVRTDRAVRDWARAAGATRPDAEFCFSFELEGEGPRVLTSAAKCRAARAMLDARA